MAESYPNAARRHRNDANCLAASKRFQNAGHLIGFAAECLAKHLFQAAGMTVDRKSGLRVHFPSLAHQIRLGHGRTMRVLLPIVANHDFLAGWNAECRYEIDMPLSEAELRFCSWRTDVESLFTAAGIA